MNKVPSLRMLSKSDIDPDQETLNPVEEEIVMDNVTPEQFLKLSEYKQRIDDIVVGLDSDQTTEFLDKIDSYATSLVDKFDDEENDFNIQPREILLFQFIAPEEISGEGDYSIYEYDLPGEHSIEVFLVEVLGSY